MCTACQGDVSKQHMYRHTHSRTNTQTLTHIYILQKFCGELPLPLKLLVLRPPPCVSTNQIIVDAFRPGSNMSSRIYYIYVLCAAFKHVEMHLFNINIDRQQSYIHYHSSVAIIVTVRCSISIIDSSSHSYHVKSITKHSYNIPECD